VPLTARLRARARLFFSPWGRRAYLYDYDADGIRVVRAVFVGDGDKAFLEFLDAAVRSGIEGGVGIAHAHLVREVKRIREQERQAARADAPAE
jgi:hypothetical protein